MVVSTKRGAELAVSAMFIQQQLMVAKIEVLEKDVANYRKEIDTIQKWSTKIEKFIDDRKAAIAAAIAAATADEVEGGDDVVDDDPFSFNVSSLTGDLSSAFVYALKIPKRSTLKNRTDRIQALSKYSSKYIKMKYEVMKAKVSDLEEMIEEKEALLDGYRSLQNNNEDEDDDDDTDNYFDNDIPTS